MFTLYCLRCFAKLKSNCVKRIPVHLHSQICCGFGIILRESIVIVIGVSWSLYTMYLTFSPRMKNNIYPWVKDLSKEENDMCRQQAAADWQCILEHRARELAPGTEFVNVHRINVFTNVYNKKTTLNSLGIHP